MNARREGRCAYYRVILGELARICDHIICCGALAMELGADGVLMAGCHLGDCHYIDGNHKTVRRVARIGSLGYEAGVKGRELAYRRGASSALEWLDARRSLRAVRIERISADADLAKALADWQAAATAINPNVSPQNP